MLHRIIISLQLKCIYKKVSVGKLRYFYLPSFGPVPLITRIHPDVKQAHKNVVRYIQNTFNVPVPKVTSYS